MSTPADRERSAARSEPAIADAVDRAWQKSVEVVESPAADRDSVLEEAARMFDEISMDPLLDQVACAFANDAAARIRSLKQEGGGGR